jgi:hypothetical protein
MTLPVEVHMVIAVGFYSRILATDNLSSRKLMIFFAQTDDFAGSLLLPAAQVAPTCCLHC